MQKIRAESVTISANGGLMLVKELRVWSKPLAQEEVDTYYNA